MLSILALEVPLPPSPPPPTPDTETSSGAPVGAIVGGVVGGLAVAAAAAAGLVYVRRRRTRAAGYLDDGGSESPKIGGMEAGRRSDLFGFVPKRSGGADIVAAGAYGCGVLRLAAGTVGGVWGCSFSLLLPTRPAPRPPPMPARSRRPERKPGAEAGRGRHHARPAPRRHFLPG